MSEAESAGLVVPARRPEIPGGPQTVAAMLERMAAEDPEREALVGRHARYGYRALDEAADRAAHALASLGVGQGDRVSASLPNHPELVIAFLGAMRLGAVWVGIDCGLAPAQKESILADAGASLFLGDDETLAEIESVQGELPALRHLVRADAADPGCPWAQRLAAAAPHPRPRPRVDPFAPAAIGYGGGTTGAPKGAVHPQHNLVLPAAVAAATGAADARRRHGLLLPLTNLDVMLLGPLAAFQVGGCCVVADPIDPAGIAEWVRAERIGRLVAAPSQYRELLSAPDLKAQDLAPLERPEAVGADCPEAFRRRYRERFHRELTLAYGLVEAPGTLARTNPDEPAFPESCGRALPHVSLEIQDEQGRALPPGQVGEICVAPAATGAFAGCYTPFLGYWRRPQETAAALRGEQLHTGDLGTLDVAGKLVVRGRQQELIRRGGARVFPLEIERVLHEDPRVAACAVVASADRQRGQRVVAFVRLERGARAGADELAGFCAARLAHYQVPDEFHFVGALPRNAMGQVRRRELRRLVER